MTASSTRRSYDSSRRQAMAEETRLAVITAASKLFGERGWNGTGMRDVAKAAGVSVETVYGTAGSKAQLLMRALDVGVVGDDQPIPLAERPQFRALAEGDRRTRLVATARLLSEQNARVAHLHRTLAHGATGDPDLAERRREVHERQRTSFREGIELVLGRRPNPALVDGIQALGSPDVYLLLVESSGWSTHHYEEWLADTMARLLEHLPEETS
jgi:AcrR family transcriptional regulator